MKTTFYIDQIDRLRDNIALIEQKIGYTFDNTALLEEAFIRDSFVNEYNIGLHSNERLEFLGDAILGAVVVKELYEYYIDKDEGFLTEMKSRTVEQDNLSYRIEKLGLYEYLCVNKSDYNGHVKENLSSEENLFEAIIGAVAVDSHYDISTVTAVIHTMLDLDDYLVNNCDDPDNYFMRFDILCDKNKYKYKKHFSINFDKEKKKFIAKLTVYIDKENHNFSFEIVGDSKHELRHEIAKLAYEELIKLNK